MTVALAFGAGGPLLGPVGQRWARTIEVYNCTQLVEGCATAHTMMIPRRNELKPHRRACVFGAALAAMTIEQATLGDAKLVVALTAVAE